MDKQLVNCKLFGLLCRLFVLLCRLFGLLCRLFGLPCRLVGESSVKTQKIKKKLNLKQSEISLESKNPYIFTFNYQPK
jgi:hypothetical protein